MTGDRLPFLRRRADVGRPRRLLLLLVVGLLLSAILLILFVRRLDPGAVIRGIGEADWVWLATALLAMFGGFLAVAVRCRLLLSPLADLPFAVVLRSQLVGYAANNLLPFRLGELAKVEFLARNGAGVRPAVLAVVATERLIDAFFFLAVASSVLALQVPVPESVRGLVLTGILLLSAFLGAWLVAGRGGTALIRVAVAIEARWNLARRYRLVESVESFLRGLQPLRSARVLSRCALSTGLYWCCGLAMFWLILRSFAVSLAWYAPGVLLTATVVGTAVPASPGFVGTYDFAVLSALEWLGVEPQLAGSIALVSHGLTVLPFTVIGLSVVPGSLAALWVSVWPGQSPDR